MSTDDIMGAITSMTEDSRDVAGINANAYAYYLFFATSSVLLLMSRIKQNVLILFVYLFLIILTSFIALRIAARQVFVIQLPLICLFLYINYIKYGTKSNKFFVVCLLSVAIIFAIPYSVTIYNDTYLAFRSETSFDEDVRSELMFEAIDIGFANPFFGVGPGNMKHFSHCSYTHMFASSGLVSLLLYILLIYLTFIEQLKLFLKTKNKQVLLLLVVTIIYATDNFVYSFFDVPFMMAFLFILIGHGRMLKQQLLYER